LTPADHGVESVAAFANQVHGFTACGHAIGARNNDVPGAGGLGVRAAAAAKLADPAMRPRR